MHVQRVEPAPGQESVWDYPRPPALERVPQRLTVTFGGGVIADTTRGWRVLETSHPPVYYFPPDDIVPGAVLPAPGGSACEWKGRASYWNVVGADGRVAEAVAWSYPDPTPRFVDIRDHVAFYCRAMDRCTVGDEVATPQPGDFYGGWVTSWVVGPFKGEPGSWGW